MSDRELLRECYEYVWHKWSCPQQADFSNRPCNCGYDDLGNRLDAALAAPTTNQLPIEHQIGSSAPACRVVPEDDLRLIAALPLSHEPMMSDLVHRSAADNMRRAADEIERKDAAIMAARRALAPSRQAPERG